MLCSLWGAIFAYLFVGTCGVLLGHAGVSDPASMRALQEFRAPASALSGRVSFVVLLSPYERIRRERDAEQALLLSTPTTAQQNLRSEHLPLNRSTPVGRTLRLL